MRQRKEPACPACPLVPCPCVGSCAVLTLNNKILHFLLLNSLGREATRGLAPKIDNKTMCWRENKQLSAAPASRRLGRAGLEAPPLRGRKILSFLRSLERNFPLENHSLTHTSLSTQSNTQKCTDHKGKVKTPPKARTHFSPFSAAPPARSDW